MTLYRKRPASLLIAGLILVQLACASLAGPISATPLEPTIVPTLGTVGMPTIAVTETPTGLMPAPITLVPATVNPTATVEASSQSANSAHRIQFAAGATSATVRGNLAASESDQYLLRAQAGQTLSLNLAFSQGQAILVVWGQDGDVLLSDHAEASSFQMVLPTTQDYYIQVHGRPDGSTAYTMTVTIPGIPTGVERITFAPGSASATLAGQLKASGSHQYILQAQAGQTLSINLTFTEGIAILVVWGADGDVLLSDHAESSIFQGNLRTTQDYYILLKGRPDGSTAYTMTVTIPPP